MWESLAEGSFAWEASEPAAAIGAIWVTDPRAGTVAVLSRAGTCVATFTPGQDWLPALGEAMALKNPARAGLPGLLAAPGQEFHRVELHRMTVGATSYVSLVETEMGQRPGRKRGLLFPIEALHREVTARFLRLACNSNVMTIELQDPAGGTPITVAGGPAAGGDASGPSSSGVPVIDRTIRGGVLTAARVRVFNRHGFGGTFRTGATLWSWMLAVIVLVALSLAYFIHTAGAKDAELDLRNDWIANLAHSLRGPVHAAGLLGEALVGLGGADTGKLGSLLSGQLEQLDRTCRRFIRLARAGHHRLVLTPEPVEIAPLVHKVLERLLIRYPRHTAQGIPVHAPAGLRVLADPEGLEEVLDTALENALKYSPLGTPVSVSAAPVDNRVFIEIRDQGLGIPAADLPKIGEPFFRASGPEREGIVGTGLGVYLASILCESMGARYSVRSDGPGKGCQTTISLPGAAA